MTEEIAFMAQGLRGENEATTGAGMILERISGDLIKITDTVLQEVAAEKGGIDTRECH